MARARPGTVILFARRPQFGVGKRRLAKSIGDLAAHRFYRRQLARSARIVGGERSWSGLVVLDPIGASARPGPIFGMPGARRLQRFDQARGDLGRRMAVALAEAPRGPKILIGADIPGLNAAILRRALKAAGGADMAFGPAEDGGFWMVGCKRAPSIRQFDRVAWSTDRTLADTVKLLPRAWRIAFADTLRDVDEADDLSPSDRR